MHKDVITRLAFCDSFKVQSTLQRKHKMTILAHDDLLSRKDDMFVAGTYVESGFRPFSYELRLAHDDCLVDGSYHPPGEDSSWCSGLIEVPPGQLAFLSTEEVFDLAPDLLGRFGLKFRYVRLGLVPLLTTFIEPGSRGRMYFPVLNASSDTVVLRAGEEILTVVFHTVSLPADISDLPSPGWNVLPTDIIEEHLKIRMVSTVQLEDRIRQIEDELEFVRGGQERVIALAVSVITATILGALLQTMFGLFAITQGIVRVGSAPSIAGMLIPSTLYCGSVVFVVLLVGAVLALRRPRRRFRT